MPRVKGGYTTRRRRKAVLKLAKGYVGSKHTIYRTANEAVMRAMQYAYRDRKQKKRDFRKLWIQRINAAAKENGLKYSLFICGLSRAGVEVNRKMLSEIAINDPKAFTDLVKVAKDGKAGKIKPATEVSGTEVTVGATKTTKKETKKEVKKETTSKDVDYSSMKVAELKEIAAEKNIDVTGMKKADIVEALTK